MDSSTLAELQIILYAMVFAATSALLLFRQDLVRALIKFLCSDDDDDDDQGGGKLIPAYARQTF
jgi:hypothetical protein